MDVALRTSMVVVAVAAGCGRIGFDATSVGGDSGNGDDTSELACATGYVPVAPLAGYTTTAFCVSKYEVRDVGGQPVSQPDGLPWAWMSRAEARVACQSIGYALITNDQWQTIARAIADEGWNWSSGVAYQGILSSGHSDSTPNVQLVAAADDDPCAGTGDTCSQTTWHKQRRVARLGNGSVLWDFGGNAGEWVDGSYPGPMDGDEYVSMLPAGDLRVTMLGTDRRCNSAAMSPYCGYGMIFANSIGDDIVRGAGLDWGTQGGVFSAALWFLSGQNDWNVGFRCAYEP